MTEYQMKFMSTLGPIYICATDDSVTRVNFSRHNVKMVREHKLISKAFEQIQSYLDGKTKKFSLPLSFNGTDFQNDVWSELQAIPYGETISYSDMAHKLKNDNAVRAVGSANGKNPLCIIIPCHRVIGKSGELSGYIGGVEIKKKLLDLENKG